jgi:hypothetical protein
MPLHAGREKHPSNFGNHDQPKRTAISSSFPGSGSLIRRRDAIRHSTILTVYAMIAVSQIIPAKAAHFVGPFRPLAGILFNQGH